MNNENWLFFPFQMVMSYSLITPFFACYGGDEGCSQMIGFLLSQAQKRMVYSHPHAIKGNEILIDATVWMNLENIMQSE